MGLLHHNGFQDRAVMTSSVRWHKLTSIFSCPVEVSPLIVRFVFASICKKQILVSNTILTL